MIIKKEDVKKAKILIVDDNSSNIDLLSKILLKDGYENIFSTTNPLEVQSLYVEHQFSLIILDLNMPNLDGFQVMRILKENFPDVWIPIIIVTAQNDQPSKIRSLSLGARDFLTKPIDRLEVINTVYNIIETKMMQIILENQNVILEQKINERTQKLKTSYNELISALGRAAEYKDNETGNHILRMALYSKEVAKAYGLSDEFSNLLQNASPMHDVGKIGIRDSILLKPGKLTPEEFEIMKEHTTIGYNILNHSSSGSQLIKLAAEIALSHHEKWDGSGYPSQLSGENIPISGRIVAVADVFDALTTTRPYKKAWPLQDALDLIYSNSGSHFDPQVVEAFQKALPAILNIQKQYNN